MPQTSTDLHRRGLLAAGLGLAVTGRSASAASRPFFQQKKLPIGIQLYTLAPEIAKDLDGTLAAVAAMGYRAVEFPGFLGRSGADIRKALDKVGLTCASAHIQPRAVGPDGGLDGDLNALADKLAAIGVKTAVAPILRVPDRYLTSPTPGGVGGLLRRLAVELTADDWKMNADFLNGVGKTLKARGLQVGYHNHNFEFAPVGDTNGLEILLKNTDPDLVTFEIDVGWVQAAGADPIALMRRHKGRFTAMHVKDLKATTKPNFELKMDPTEVGSGMIDWKALMPAAHTAGVRGFYVEQEPPFERPRLEAARISHDFLAGLTV